MLVRALIAAILGTVAMTLSSQTEAALTRRGASETPGRILAALLTRIGGPKLAGRAESVASVWMHWLYGAAWGVLWWILASHTLLGIRLEAATPVFLAVVWGTSQLVTTGLGVTDPPWRQGPRALLLDLWHHAVYAAGTAGGWVVLDRAFWG